MATQANITVDQGSDFLVDIDLTDNTGAAMDLSGHSVAGTIKKSYTSSNSVSFTASVSDAENGIITLSLTNAQTSTMKSGRYVYDVEITDTVNTTVTRVLEGQVYVTPSVT